MSTNTERFTRFGSAELECLVASIVHRVGATIQEVVAADCYQAVLLIGGYGRGEGGVRPTPTGDRPNNNLDFLMIVRRGCLTSVRDCEPVLQEKLAELQREFEIGIDFSTVTEGVLRRSACRVMWYDMRFGHRVVLGSREYVGKLTQFRRDRIPDWDIHNLLVNRATLLVINDLLAEQALETQDLRRVRVRHAVKAIIGYGDALLHVHGNYHWSYAEKQRRMRFQTEIPTAFRHLYDQAAEYRFRPDAEYVPPALTESIGIWQECESAHFLFEQRRLGRQFHGWDEYLTASLAAGVWEDAASPTGCLRMLRNAYSHRLPLKDLSGLWPRIGNRVLPAQRILGLLFPFVAYPSCPVHVRDWAAATLSAEANDVRSLRLAYLRSWGQFVDRNFARFLTRTGVSHEGEVVQ